jgi:hypothetical protein
MLNISGQRESFCMGIQGFFRFAGWLAELAQVLVCFGFIISRTTNQKYHYSGRRMVVIRKFVNLVGFG